MKWDEYILSNPVLRIGRKRIKPKQEDFWYLTWGEIIQLKKWLIKSNWLDVIKFFYGVSDKQLAVANPANVMSVQKWIAESMKEIAEREISEFTDSVISDRWASDKLKRFEHAIELDMLSNGDILKEDTLLNMPYVLVFRKLSLIKVKGEINRKHIEDVGRKNARSMR